MSQSNGNRDFSHDRPPPELNGKDPHFTRLGLQLKKLVHEYNQVLCVILANAELAALANPEDAARLAEEFEGLRRAARRAIDLTRQLQALGEDLAAG